MTYQGPPDFEPVFRWPPFTREAEEFISPRFSRVENPQARFSQVFEDNAIWLDLTENILRDAALLAAKAVEQLTDESLAAWLTSRGWACEPPTKP